MTTHEEKTAEISRENPDLTIEEIEQILKSKLEKDEGNTTCYQFD